MKRLKVGQFFTLARLLINAIHHALRAAQEARDPATPGGSAVTPEEAAEITVAALSAIADDLQAMLVDP